MANLKMLRLPDGSFPRNPGEYSFANDRSYLRMVQPNGDFVNLPITRGPTTGAPDVRWHWDGNEDAPTIEPSIDTTGHASHWHGFVTRGEMVTV